ncbi:AGAMOUS-like 26 [Prunus dulcis]|uniref:AGAMOUS-like 26 n=1 Tax=Prunus dulcis TaxID=3755 RepID=A0A4Y1QWX3_PRUDU|nr:AGAMOUS-like 26 [Prunus dulcis]
MGAKSMGRRSSEGSLTKQDSSSGSSISSDSWKYRLHCQNMCSISCWTSPSWGFKVDDAKLKRAGLDYWPYVVVKVHSSWAEFQDYFRQQDGEKRLLAFTKRGTKEVIFSYLAQKPRAYHLKSSKIATVKHLADIALD